MPFCSSCGKEANSRFCPQCGAAIGGSATVVTPVSLPGLQTNVAAALCYALGLVTGILFLVIAPYNQNPTIRFHAFQSIFVHLAWIVVWIGYGIVSAAMPFALHFLATLLSLVVGLGGFLMWLFLMWKAYQGEKVVLPVVGPIAEQQAARA